MAIVKIQITKQLIYKLLIILAVSGGLVYLGLIINERRQFNSAERQIDDLYAKIVETVGQPDQEIKDKSCGRSSAKFSKGNLGCSVAQELTFTVNDAEEANRIMRRVFKLSGGSRVSNFGGNLSSFTQNTPELSGYNQDLSQDYGDIRGLSCGVYYSYPNTSNEKELGQSINISFSCSKSTLLKYF
jgi:hypothetical protein